MKISVEKYCSMIFTKNNKESSVFNLRIYGNRIANLKEIKFLERCNSRLNLIKILSNKKWGLDLNTLGNLYKSLIGSILDYSFPCLNSLSETNIKRLEVIQNSAVRSILKLRYYTPSNILHNEAYNKLKLLTVSNRLFELSERYVRAGLSHSVPLTIRLVEEYNRGFESRYIENPTPLCNCYLTISSFFPESSNN
ncbi:RNA-directed DNA polymerase from mobile element jockey-like [Brachionus plicatilis]|uniref:RNA-directed DNA polymerase from mobile element jockey-like n=1 Tax=Brachionus plicatilis TaxID=10195 RepID=A0A3M7QCT6_BRAPC|nr:RNA-directed DNA polymerase from mobile element jockey-like [Brachionus plicatilis]